MRAPSSVRLPGTWRHPLRPRVRRHPRQQVWPAPPSPGPGAFGTRSAWRHWPWPAAAEGTSGSETQGLALELGQASGAAHGEVQEGVTLVSAEGAPLGRTLDLDEVSSFGDNAVHVDLGFKVFGIAEVEPWLTSDHAHAHRAEHVADRNLFQLTGLMQFSQ